VRDVSAITGPLSIPLNPTLCLSF